jgi:hypothetical protein
VIWVAKKALKTKRFRQSGRRPVKATFLQSQKWDDIGNFLASIAFVISFVMTSSFWLAGLAWLIVGAGLVYFLPNYDYAKRRKEADDAYQLELLKDPRKTLMVGAEDHLRALGKAYAQLPYALGQQVETLHAHATAILNAVDSDVAKSVPIVPFFVTHLPDAARLATQRVGLGDNVRSERKAQIDAELIALTHVFAAAETAMMGRELAAVDIDMRLLADALEVEAQDLAR